MLFSKFDNSVVLDFRSFVSSYLSKFNIYKQLQYFIFMDFYSIFNSKNLFNFFNYLVGSNWSYV